MKMKVKAIVWDLDGTLINFKIDSLNARRAVVKLLKEKGVSREFFRTQRSTFEIINKSQEILKEIGLSQDEIEEMIAKVNNAVVEIEEKAALEASLITGIEKVLEFIEEIGIKQAIFTFNTFRNAKLSLEKADILHYFETIAGRDNVAHLKPHPDHLNYICETLKVKPDEIIVIGDSSKDIEAALNVGAKSIGIKTPISRVFQDELFEKANSIIPLDGIPLKLIEELQKVL
jgi:HAD superfamily hydrolase (TIGR01549 family)